MGYWLQHAATWVLGRNGPMVRPTNPLFRPLEIGVLLRASCQRDVPNVPPFLKAALGSTAGEVQKLQHLDFSFVGGMRPKSFACEFRGAGRS